jgi:hypothetical protein
MRAEELNPEFRNNNQDHIMQRHMHDSRKPKITLRLLNKLKTMRAAKDLENLIRSDFMQTLYGAPDEQAPGGGLGL